MPMKTIAAAASAAAVLTTVAPVLAATTMTFEITVTGVNGSAVRSCTRRVSTVANMEVTTVEGLSPEGTTALQRAWEELDVPQCGYCQAGQLMSAAALLASTPNPTDADIDRAMAGNICRCGTYLRIRKAIHEAAALASADAGRPSPAAE